MFCLKRCAETPVGGGPEYGGGLVKLNNTIMWAGGEDRGVYMLNESMNMWDKVTDGFPIGAKLAVCGGHLVAIGGLRDGLTRTKNILMWNENKWTNIPDMLVICERSCVVSIGGDILVVMGGMSEDDRFLNTVQVFDGKSQTWYYGPSLPWRCMDMSAVVYDNKIIMMGGAGTAKSVCYIEINELVSYRHMHTEIFNGNTTSINVMHKYQKLHRIQ